MRRKPADPDRVVATAAGQKFGIVTIEDLLSAGLSEGGVRRRLRRGWLHRLYRGVYAVGNPNPSIEGRYLAAVLACGEDAALSHRSAAAHWRMLTYANGPVHVTIPDRGSRARRNGIHLHRSSVLGFQEVTRHRSIPITNPGRTLADLRTTQRPEVVRRAARQAAVLGLNTGDEGEQDRTRSELERRMLWLFRRHRLPLPEVNVHIGGMTVDFLLREAWVVIETDGWQFHRGREAFEDDRGRDARLRQLGFEVLRFSHRQVFHEPDVVVGVIRETIHSRSALFRRYPTETRRGDPGGPSR